MLPDSSLSWFYEDCRNNSSNTFHSICLVQHKDFAGSLPVSRGFEEISFLMYNMISPPFEWRSSLYGGLKSWIKKFPIRKLSSILFSETIKTSTLHLTCSERNSSLFLIELMFRWAKANLLKLLQRKDFNTLLPSVTLHCSTLKAVLFLSLCQVKIIDLHSNPSYLHSNLYLKVALWFDWCYQSSKWSSYQSSKCSSYQSSKWTYRYTYI